MPTSVTLPVDVTDAAALGMPARTVATVVAPDDGYLTDPPVVCFALPGAGYGRGYYTFDMPGSSGGGEAGWHADRGWIFVACDGLGVGEATNPDTPERTLLTYEVIARSNRAMVESVLARLAEGGVVEGLPRVADPVVLGVGQSMGGSFTVALQGQYHVFDGVAILGFSAFHTVVPSRPGSPPMVMPWIVRGTHPADPVTANAAALLGGHPPGSLPAGDVSDHPLAWGFHYDDVPPDIVAADLAGYLGGPSQPWRSPTIPACAVLGTAPGVVATEAAAITVPVLIAAGVRDVLPDPWLEPKAYRSANDISLFVCPRMAHMHNFASTRELLWERIHHWGDGVGRR